MRFLDYDKRILSAMGINVMRFAENGRITYLVYKRQELIKHVEHIRNGLINGKFEVIYELFDGERFKLQTVFYGLGIKKRDNYWCPTKVMYQIKNSEEKRDALIQRFQLMLDYLNLYQQQQDEEITSVPSLSKSTRPV